MNSRSSIILLLLCIPALASDLDSLASRLEALAQAGSGSAASRVPGYLSILADSGRFSDVDYGTTGGLAVTHLQRLQTMAQAFTADTGRWAGDSVLARKLVAGIGYWVRLNLQDANWWYRYIGYTNAFWQPVVLADSLLAARDTVVRRGAWNYLLWAIRYGSAGYKTGANLVNIVSSALPAGVMMRDSSLSDSLVRQVTNETRYMAKDGIHLDASFSQHTGTGLQLYAGTYGQEFAKSVSSIGWLVRSTAFAYDAATLDRYEHYLLDGARWMTWGAWFDIGAIGRGISRSGSSAYGSGFAVPARQFAQCLPSRAGELNTWAADLDAGRPSSITGNRLFWRHDFSVHRTPTWYASVRATSTRTVGNESGNGEGLRDEHMGDGMLMLLRGSADYRDIFPVWDWHRLPGVTEALHGDVFALHDWGAGGLGGSAFAGGASDGAASVMVMRRSATQVTENKFWLLCDAGVAALGSGVTSSASDPVVTTMDQILSSGTLLVNAAAVTDTASLRGPAVIRHNGRSYLVPDSAALSASVRDRSGSWQLINNGGSATVVTRKVVTLSINHGTQPTGRRYCYAVVPDTTAGLSALSVPRNDDTVQAASFPAAGAYGAAFLFPAQVRFSGGLRFSLDRKGVVLARRSNGGLWVSVNDPGRAATSLALTVSDSASGIDTTLTLALPQADSAGAGRTVFLASSAAARQLLRQAMTGRFSVAVRGTTVSMAFAPAGRYELQDLSGRVLAAWSQERPSALVVRSLPPDLAQGVLLLRVDGLDGEGITTRTTVR
jgi:chondroitin AC lyase